MHENVVSCYMNLFQMIVFLPAVYISGNDLAILRSFSISDSLCIVGVGGLTLVN